MNSPGPSNWALRKVRTTPSALSAHRKAPTALQRSIAVAGGATVSPRPSSKKTYAPWKAAPDVPPIALPRDADAVLTAANVSEGQRLTPDDVHLGGLSQVVAAVIDDEALLYGEFQVEATTVEDWEPGQTQPAGPALSGVVEDWRSGTDGMVTLSAYVYVQTHEHGPLGVTLREALETLNTVRARYLDQLRSRPAD